MPTKIVPGHVGLNQGWIDYAFEIQPGIDGSGWVLVSVADAAGVHRSAGETIDFPVTAAQPDQSGSALIPVDGLPDGDYVAWLSMSAMADGDIEVFTEHRDVSFLLAGGVVYASTEAPPAAPVDNSTAVTVGQLRLDGSWVVIDLVSSVAHPTTVNHTLVLDGVTDHDLRHDYEIRAELVAAHATQQAHYLLPDDLEDGDWAARPYLQNEGAELGWDGTELRFTKQGTSVTHVP